MRIHVLSDLHLEFGPTPIPEVEADAVILAGDISVGFRGVEWAARRFGGRPVVYVPGNHEYYGQVYPRFLERLRVRADELGVILLSDAFVTIREVRFLGATLWTDFELLGDRRVAELTAQEEMVDYRKIRVEPRFRRARPSDTQLWHRHSRGWLERELSTHHRGPTVVITHHAPSRRSLDLVRVPRTVDAAYASALDGLVRQSGASCWVHGHTHFCVDYAIGATRVVSNARGYHDEPVRGFDPALVIEVSARTADATADRRPFVEGKR